MLTKIAVRNFQSLAAVTLDLGRITVIVGHTDSGKSAFLRAVEAAVFNDSVFDSVTHIEPQGGAEKITVALQSAESTVLWEKTKSSTHYKLLLPGQAPQVFGKMGRGFVPEEIQSALGFRELQADKNIFYRLQFASQHDAPFLVIDRGGVFASRILGRLTGVNILSYAGKHAQHDKGQANEQKQRELQRVGVLQTELQGFVKIEQRKHHLLDCKRSFDLLKTRQTLLRNQSLLISQWRQCLEISKQLSVKPNFMNSVKGVEHQLQQLWPRLGRLEQQSRLLGKSRDSRIKLEELSNSVNKSLLVRLQKPTTSLSTLDKLLTLLQSSQSRKAAEAAVKLKAMQCQSQYDALVKSVSEFDEQFPLCPFQPEFSKQQGIFRCSDLMSVVNKR